jgi:hypothetical protein
MSSATGWTAAAGAGSRSVSGADAGEVASHRPIAERPVDDRGATDPASERNVGGFAGALAARSTVLRPGPGRLRRWAATCNERTAATTPSRYARPTAGSPAVAGLGPRGGFSRLRRPDQPSLGPGVPPPSTVRTPPLAAWRRRATGLGIGARGPARPPNTALPRRPTRPRLPRRPTRDRPGTDEGPKSGRSAQSLGVPLPYDPRGTEQGPTRDRRMASSVSAMLRRLAAVSPATEGRLAGWLANGLRTCGVGNQHSRRRATRLRRARLACWQRRRRSRAGGLAAATFGRPDGRLSSCCPTRPTWRR